MPRPLSSGGEHTAATNSYEVASANSTLNVFIGGKQKSWMTNTVAVQPSPRPSRPAQQSLNIYQPPIARQARPTSQQLSPAVLPNLLPSPAPSDEPSPSLSNPKDSPDLYLYPPTVSRLNQAPSAHALAVEQPMSPDSHERAEVAAHVANSNATTEAESSANTQIVHHNMPWRAGMSQAVVPSLLPQISQIKQVSIAANVPVPTTPSDAAQQGQIPMEEPTAKRRRLEPSRLDTASQMAELLKAVENKILESQHLNDQVERPRLYTLKEACMKHDIFYLHLHSMYCTWTIDPKTLPSMPGYDMNTIHEGFVIVGSVLRRNDQFTRPNLEWCAKFPNPTFNWRNPTAVAQVARFLTSLALHWRAFFDGCIQRQYPFLVDELLNRLHCFSVVMQCILFTACRRVLGLADGTEFGVQAQIYFEEDLKHHLNEKNGFGSITNSPEGSDSAWNLRLIYSYRQLMECANNQQRQNAIWQPQQVQQQPQQQRPYGQNIPTKVQSNPVAFRAVARSNAGYSADQITVATTSQARRASLNPHSPVIQSPNQRMSWPQQASNPFPVAGPRHFTPQSSATIPNTPDVAVRQWATNQQFQAQSVSSPQQYHSGFVPRTNQQFPAQTVSSHQQYYPTVQGQNLPTQQQIQQYIPQQTHPQWSQATPNSYSPQYGTPQAFNVPLTPQNHPGSHTRGSTVPQEFQMNQQVAPVTFNRVSQTSRLVPQFGQIIDRSQYPHSHQERKSLFMSIHQAHARSPERTLGFGVEERCYQYVHSFAVVPFRLAYLHQLDITISPEQHSRLCRQKQLPSLDGKPTITTVREYTNGSLRLRARCCRLQSNVSDPCSKSDWVTKESMWPEHIYMRFNNQSITIRRSTHNGKDLPVELTDFVLPGINKFEVTTSRKGPTTANKRGNTFYMAVEIVKTVSHSEILDHVQKNGRIDREVTLNRIRSRVHAIPDEDGIAIIDRAGDTTQELSIDLTDPFSAKIFEVPARGVSCTHMECFDLETWLITRPVKQQIKCGHKDVCTCPRRMEPTEPDKWKCPICFGDATPESLRIDTFLEDVRRLLQTGNKLDTKSILVAADGTWRPVAEPVDDDDDSDIDGTVRQKADAPLRNEPSKSVPLERAPVEIIELD